MPKDVLQQSSPHLWMRSDGGEDMIEEPQTSYLWYSLDKWNNTYRIYKYGGPLYDNLYSYYKY